ncbi:MAG TPA: divalent metal cation transporter [Kofleriaceae bacterium]
MSKILELVLGIMTSLGGFVDIGELVFMSQAGALFGYSLLWAIALGTVGIILYSEMCGRIAAVARQPVFVVIRQRMGKRVGFVVWLASTIVNIATCAAEIGGVAMMIRLLVGFGGWWLPLAVAAVLIVMIAALPFKWIERTFGLAGLVMAVFFVAFVAIDPDWGKVGTHLLPNLPALSGHEYLLYAYFVVGILSSVMMPYEVYFYSSGGIEEGWKAEDTKMNKVNTILGFTLGSVVAMAILVLGADLFGPLSIVPDNVGSPALLVGIPFGPTGIVLALIGMLAAIAGAAVETSLAGAYNFAQYFGFKWGRSRPLRETKRFDAAWIVIFLLGGIVMATGIDPIVVVELSVMLAVLCLPFTYLPILLTARDTLLMGKYRNGPIAQTLGWIFFVIISICSLAAPFLIVATGMGKY